MGSVIQALDSARTSGKHYKLPTQPSENDSKVAIVRGNETHLVPVIFKVVGDDRQTDRQTERAPQDNQPTYAFISTHHCNEISLQLRVNLRKTKEDLGRGCRKGLSSSKTE